jgi:hypothetical protein
VHRGDLRRGSLRFLDDTVERLYQRQEGAESRTGFRISTGTAAVLWLLAVVVIPSGTPIAPERVIPLCLAMAVLNPQPSCSRAGRTHWIDST